MQALETVFCPVDFSPDTDRQVQAAEEVCAAFDATLVLHHNVVGPAPGLHKAWEWSEEHRPTETDEDAATRLRRLVERVGVRAEARVTEGPLRLVLDHLMREIGADLVVLASHGETTDDHTSLTECILGDGECAVLALPEDDAGRRLRLRPERHERPAAILVPTDLSPAARRATELAFELARRLPLEVHLLHVETGFAGLAAQPIDAVAPVSESRERATSELRRRLRESLPEDLETRIEIHLARGRPAERVLELAALLDPELIVMGEHARGFFRRFFTADTARRMLHRAPCPVWFVPPSTEH